MDYKNAFHLFQTLLEEGDENLEQRLLNFITLEHDFFNETTKLIAAHQANRKETLVNNLINGQAKNLVDDSQIHELLNTQIAQYSLTKKLGQGGMGAVYLGERNDGQIEQKVAIKFVYPSIVTLAGEDFLQKEAQHLANLEHTNIAKIFTVGTTDDELPYMVMEYVEGVPIDEYCDDNKLDLKVRLKLFQKVCSAVHEAHQNMVIHADIKPSNILVDKQGEPKLMDFGIARSINQVIDGSTFCEEQKKNYLQAMSRAYASPEQLEGKSLTKACDVFSLGKVLDEVVKSFLPDKELKALLDASLSVDIKGRIKYVQVLIDDIERYIKNYPLESYKGDYKYSLLKIIQRNRFSAAFSLVFSVAIIALLVQLATSNTKLLAENTKVKQLSNYLTGFIESSDPTLTNGNELLVKDLLVKGYKSAKTSLKSQPNIQASLLSIFSTSFINLGLYQENINLFDDAEESIIQSHVNTDIYAQLLLNHGISLQKIGNYKIAKQRLSKVIAISLDLKDKTLLIYAYTALAEILATNDQHEQAIEYLKLAIEVPKSQSNDINAIVNAYSSLAEVYREIELYEDATKLIKKSIDLAMSEYGNKWPQLVGLYNLYGEFSVYKSDFNLANVYYSKALELSKLLYGDEHTITAETISNLAMLKNNIGNHQEAIELHMQALRIIEKSSGKNSHMSAETNNDIGISFQSLGLPEKSLIYFQAAENIFRKLYGNNHSDVATVISNRASSLNKLGLFDEVTLLQKESIRIAEATYGRKSTDVAIRLGHIGSSLLNQKKVEESLPYILESLKIGEAVFGKVHDRYSDNLRVYARYLSASGAFKDAEEAFQKTIDICKEVYKTGIHSEISDSLNGLGELYRRSGEIKKSKIYIEKALVMYISLGSNTKKILNYKLNLAKTQLVLKEKEAAEDIFKEIVIYYKNNNGYSGHPDNKKAKMLLSQLTSEFSS
jgi:serine/threonine protein kinase